MEKYILVDSSNVVVGIVEGTSVFDLLDSGIEFYASYPLIDSEPNIGDVYNP
jgi:hypothetical protein